MKPCLHITGGDRAGESLRKSGVAGEVFVWHDILYEGPRNPGWPSEGTLEARARFLEEATGGGLAREQVLETLKAQYRMLETVEDHDGLVLWFDACLFDQAMLCHILACMKSKGIERGELLCLDAFSGIAPFHGLGQLLPGQFASAYDRRSPVTREQFDSAESIDRAFALQDRDAFLEISGSRCPALPWVPAAVARWLREEPDEATGLGLLERLALEAVRSGARTPAEIFASASAAETPPQYWGDITLWAKINALAMRTPPLVRIEGPSPRLPQWNNETKLAAFRVEPL